jgi:hypothetical protein
VGLTTSGEDIDALHRMVDGRLVISVQGTVEVPGIFPPRRDEDLLIFTPANLGETTDGTWKVLFDGSDVGLGGEASEDVSGVWIDEASNDIYLSTISTFQIPGLAGDGDTIFVCHPEELGADDTRCTFTLFWDGSEHGFAGERIKGFFIQH